MAWLEGELPPLAASLLLYVIAFSVCFFLYTVTKLVTPKTLQPYMADFFKTLVICTYPYGHGLIRETYGHVGYCLAAVPLVVFTLNVFSKGLSSPLAIFLEFLDKKHTSLDMVIHIAVQIVAGFASFRLVRFVWYLEMHSSHVLKLNEIDCVTDLTVPVTVGFLIEMAGVGIDTLISCMTLFRNELVDLTVKVFIGAILVCCGVHMTGMYMHPVMASGLTFGCRGTSAWEHVLVYWASGFIGCYVAFVLHRTLTSLGKTKKLKTDTANNESRKMEQNANYMDYPQRADIRLRKP
ncbi:aquaporin-11-like [Gigantopelta aegis]|uniref:aquaporin-11-like n=1 Tax=Gigantopelta aegis TaxID=1735272 RepID=UPI001B88AFE5|nr:aquaporin-11-like [Gigantopelta aegis]